MDFSTKAIEGISKLVEEEIGELIQAGEIADIQTLEQSMREILHRIGQRAYGKVLDREDKKLETKIECECGRRAIRISKREAKVMTVFGRVSYSRSYYGCPGCGEKQHYLDKKWGIKPGEVSPVLGKLLAIAGVDIAFERARRSVQEYLLVDVSDNTIRKQTQQIGQKQAQQEAEWVKDSQDEGWLQERERAIKTAPERLYGSLDGAQVPIGDEWRELKSLSWYRVDTVYGQKEQKAQEISYHCEIAPAQEFGRLFWATGIRRYADKAKELIFVCDGAIWIWNLISHYFPDAVQIVDWYHACEYFTPIADAVFSDENLRKEWLKQIKEQLWNGNIQKVILACQQFSCHRQAQEAVHRAITYFTNNQHRMDYAEYRKKGYWIGSRTVESACKQIATARLKISGARWTISGAIATAKARAAWLSDNDYFNTLALQPLTG